MHLALTSRLIFETDLALIHTRDPLPEGSLLDSESGGLSAHKSQKVGSQ